MNLVFSAILITIFAMGAFSEQNCQRMKELEDACGGYCYKVVHPVLEHSRSLQKKLDENEKGQKSQSLEKLEKMEKFLTQKLDNLESKVLAQMENQKKAIEANRKPFTKIGAKYYHIENNIKANWFTAAHNCIALGGHLITLQNSAEFNAVRNKLTHRFYWTDINDLGSEGTYNSLTTGRLANFLEWFPGEPNNANESEDCVELRDVDKVYTMNDCSCVAQHHYICEREY